MNALDAQSRFLSTSLVLAHLLNLEHIDAQELASTMERFLAASEDYLTHVMVLPAAVEAHLWNDAA